MITAHRYLTRLIALGVVVQFFLAGAGAFGATSFEPHRALGTILIGLAALAVVTALLARTFIRHSVVLLGLLIVQAALGVLGADTQAWFGALHAVNALAVLAAAGTLARRTTLAGHGRFTGRPPWRHGHQHGFTQR
jgi:hypothetical protein